MAAAPLFVDADSMAAEPDGTAWATAFVDLQDALDRAATLNVDAEPDNDISDIWIADGLYLPTANKDGNHSPTDQRNALFKMLSGVSLRGGFAGDEILLDDRARDVEGSWTHETILSGDLNGDDDPANEDTLDDNSYTVVYAIELAEPVVLDGLTITAGNANGIYGALNPEWRRGGGVYAESSQLTITDSTISGNSGGGVYSTEGTLIVTDSTISDNSAGFGGGIYSTKGTLTITDSTLSGNSAKADGGGVYCTEGTVTLTNSTLSGNAAVSRGGAVHTFRCRLTIIDSTISDNSVNQKGGGISIDGGEFAVISGSTISNNVSRYQWGGGIFTLLAKLTITDSTISGNSADGAGGGMKNDHGTVTITDSTMFGNSASSGGAAFNLDTTFTITNSTVSGNSARGSGGGIRGYRPLTVIGSTISGNSSGTVGGGIYVSSESTATIEDSTISHNTAGETGGGIYLRDETALLTLGNTVVAQNAALQSAPDAFGDIGGTYNLIGDGSDMTGLSNGADGNLIGTSAAPIDPLFVQNPSAGPDGVWATEDDDPGDLRLLPDSPAVDAGDNALLPADEFDLDGDGDTAEPIPVDLAGNPRVWNETVDMGAYEYLDTGLLHPGDANFDGVTDLSDFNVWNANKFTDNTAWATADFNGGGLTDLSDFNIWNAYKFTSAPQPAPVDAAYGQAGTLRPSDVDFLEHGLTWLREFDQAAAHATSNKERSTTAAIDLLLASYWESGS